MLTASMVKRSPKLVASRARGSCLPGQCASTHFVNGAKHRRTSTSRRFSPHLSSASKYHSRMRCRALSYVQHSAKARNFARVVAPHTPVSSIAKHHCANTHACASANTGNPLVISAIHCDNPPGCCIVCLQPWLVVTNFHAKAHDRHLPILLLYDTYPRKGRSRGPAG